MTYNTAENAHYDAPKPLTLEEIKAEYNICPEALGAIEMHYSRERAEAVLIVTARMLDWQLSATVAANVQARVLALAWALNRGVMTGHGSMAESAEIAGISRSAMQQLVSRCRIHLGL